MSAYRKPGRQGYEYRITNVGWRKTTDLAWGGERDAEQHLSEFSAAGWRLIYVTDGGKAWTFIWERECASDGT